MTERKLRYPGNDPENGPAEWHVRRADGGWTSERELREASWDWRKRKRVERGGDDEVYWAYEQGQWDACTGRTSRAHTMYAPGRRRQEYLRGYGLADPLGDWHGRNA
jgi:hypothetical protein